MNVMMDIISQVIHVIVVKIFVKHAKVILIVQVV